MGTMIHSKGVPLERSFDEVNISQPGIVEEIHRGYVDAGAQIIETNTFGANRIKLESYGLGDKVRDISIAGALLARRCAEDRALVAGSVGPTSRLLQPLGPLDFDEACDIYKEQIAALCEGGVDLLIIETMQDLREAKAALLAAKIVTEIPVICQMSFAQEGRTTMGTAPDIAAVVLGNFGARLVGANCGTGPQDMLDAIRAMAEVTPLGLAAQPNAGLPRLFEGRLMYLSTPEYMAEFARRFVETGAVLVGGCCGTTPEHVKMIASAVSGMVPVTRTPAEITRVASRTKLFEIGAGRPVLVGNRMDAHASRELTADIKDGHFKLVQDEAESQFQNGAEIISLDCDVNGDRSSRRLVELVQTACPAALCLAGSTAAGLEEALRGVDGRALVMLRDSVHAVVESLLPLAKRYGAVAVARVDVGDTDSSPEDKLRIAGRVVRAAEQLGLGRTSILIHVGGLFAGGNTVSEDTLRAVRLIKSDLGVGVVVEHMATEPSGDALITALRKALESGADVLIANPLASEVKAVMQDRD